VVTLTTGVSVLTDTNGRFCAQNGITLVNGEI